MTWVNDVPNISKSRKKEYDLWRSLKRKTEDKKWIDKNPSYEGVSISPLWRTLSTFLFDISNMVGYEMFINSGWQLDKDILSKGCKVYSKETCCFLPKELNLLLTSRKRFRGKNLIGVTWVDRDKRFVAQLSVGSKRSQKILGYFKYEKEAFYAYKVAKEAFIKEKANKWKDQIDPRAYEALMNYQVDITD